MSVNEPSVLVRGVFHTFGKGPAANPTLKNNNLELFPGEVVIMTGQSGSGKTTLLTLIGGLRRLQQGSIRVLGHELAGMSDADFVRLRRRIGFIFQAHNLFGSLTARRNVRLALELDGVPQDGSDRPANPSAVELDRRPLELLSEVKLAEHQHKKPQNLSGGQRQRVAIARALAADPRLILADEPTAALDAGSADIVVRLFRQRAEERGCTVIIVTHDTKILETAHRIVNMKYGEIVSNIDVARAKQICAFITASDSLRELIPRTLSEVDLAVANKMVDELFPAGATIVRQGEIGDRFFIIRRGTVAVLRDRGEGPARVDQMGPGQFFGEVALLRNEPRNATIVAETSVELFALAKTDFEEILKTRGSFESQVRDALALRL
jgi:putative ABC transport system ATP-binding protein